MWARDLEAVLNEGLAMVAVDLGSYLVPKDLLCNCVTVTSARKGVGNRSHLSALVQYLPSVPACGFFPLDPSSSICKAKADSLIGGVADSL